MPVASGEWRVASGEWLVATSGRRPSPGPESAGLSLPVEPPSRSVDSESRHSGWQWRRGEWLVASVE